MIDFILHFDRHLALFVQQYGAWSYGVLTVIVFCETGLVITPFLPGDSLLFAVGALAASGAFRLDLVIALLITAAVVGDAVNYAVGHYLGPKVLTSAHRFLRKEYLERTHRFYAKYGGKTIVLARFVPIIRTFAPFLAGVGRMSYPRFAVYNVTGAVAWVLAFVLGGYYFGNIPVVKSNFTLVILGIILVSVLPVVIELWRARHPATG